MLGLKNVFSKARKIDDTPPFTVPTKFERTNKTSNQTSCKREVHMDRQRNQHRLHRLSELTTQV